MKVAIPVTDVHGIKSGRIENFFKEVTVEVNECCDSPDLAVGWTIIPNFRLKDFGYPNLHCKSCGKRVDAGYDEISEESVKFLAYEWNRVSK